MDNVLEKGNLIAFDYPRHNYRRLRRRQLEPRRLLIEKVRDLRDEPFEPWELEFVDPEVDRGKLLIYGLDLDKHEPRKFYVESMARLRTWTPDDGQNLPPLRVLILRNGSISRVSLLDDPRKGYLREFNAINQGRGGVSASA